MGNCPTCSSEVSFRSLDPECKGKRVWLLYLSISTAIFCIGGLILSTIELVHHLFNQRRKKQSSNMYQMKKTDKEYLESKSIDDNKTDQKFKRQEKFTRHNTLTIIMTSCIFICNLVSIILYCVETKLNPYIESCVDSRKSFGAISELGLNIIFFICFLIHLFDAQSKTIYWISLDCIVDILTIPPSFISFYIEHRWTGFRCLRALHIMRLPDILQTMLSIEQTRAIRLVRLLSSFVSIWFAVAGLIHLVENTGDFFCNYCNGQIIDLADAVYFIIITMTTVGYGDFSCKTYIGKSIILVSLIIGMTTFASMIPEFADLFGRKSTYSSGYQPVKGKRHVIICGHITPHSLGAFLRDFLHESREEAGSLDVVVINKNIPSLEMEVLLKRYHMNVHYFVGSVMKVADLQRIQANIAKACLIIANKECGSTAGDDSENMMRAISLKNFHPDIRILLQLFHYGNKLNVTSIPNWNSDYDEIICISELKLGLIGISCVVPGFATMITNIFRTSSYDSEANEEKRRAYKKRQANNGNNQQYWAWRDLYYRGAGMKLFLEPLPNAFRGKSFAEVALICFKLHVMLIAVETKQLDDNGNFRTVIDVVPCDDCRILPNSRGFMICLSNQDVQRVKNYCSICHSMEASSSHRKHAINRKCRHGQDAVTDQASTCYQGATEKQEDLLIPIQYSLIKINDSSSKQLLPHSHSWPMMTTSWNRCNSLLEEEMFNFDSTGMVYFNEPRSLDHALLDKDLLIKYHSTSVRLSETETTNLKHPVRFKNHIIVCLHANKFSSPLGLRNFVMPLRASSLRREELSTIIFVTELDYIKKEWKLLSTFPDIYILNGSPMNQFNLKLLSIMDSCQCVIMSTSDRTETDSYLMDKSSVLCALSIRQISIKHDRLNRMSSSINHQENATIHVKTLTSLMIESNVQFVEQGYADEDVLDFYLTTPFASGAAFSDSVLDCILSCAYYNNSTTQLLRTLLMGGKDPTFEEHLSEERCFIKCEIMDTLKKLTRSRISLIAIADLYPQFESESMIITFEDLFLHALMGKRTIVLGIYRLLKILGRLDPTASKGYPFDKQKRIVIYYPPHDYQMDPTDMIYIMQHSHLKENGNQ